MIDGTTSSDDSEARPVQATPSAAPQLHAAVFAEALRAARQSTWLAGQPAVFVEELLRYASPRRWVRGECVIAFEECGAPLYFILHGAIEVSVPRHSLDVALTHVIPGGCWVGEHDAVTGSASAAEFRALAQGYALAIPRNVVQLLMVRGNGMKAFLALLNLSHRNQLAFAADLVNHNSEQRVRARLGTLARMAAGKLAGEEVTLSICHDDLAAISCSSRSTVCKVLNELEQRKAIRQGYREIKVRVGAETYIPNTAPDN